ncbi:hypothetical protein BCR34DRAFT_631133 [Clohesyomyces aquaticus]|uniref:Uncharacterized protein n=1 Tax=Clohesyomyces aquaticus TaxID=1231657 RepID=A0A1Y1ZC63_9PLEO|nr:hypothetical protein BCR34DRAFT_631133 [Clohesyomyces aquaticus]
MFVGRSASGGLLSSSCDQWLRLDKADWNAGDAPRNVAIDAGKRSGENKRAKSAGSQDEYVRVHAKFGSCLLEKRHAKPPPACRAGGEQHCHTAATTIPTTDGRVRGTSIVHPGPCFAGNRAFFRSFGLATTDQPPCSGYLLSRFFAFSGTSPQRAALHVIAERVIVDHLFTSLAASRYPPD